MLNNEINNKYYTLKEIETKNLTALKYRQLKNRIKELITANDSNIGNLIFKGSKSWFIHPKAIHLFTPKRVHDKSKVRAVNYKNEITINLPSNYDTAFYNYLGETIAKDLKGSKTIFSVETKDGKHHLHAGTTAQHHIIVKKLKVIETRLNLAIINNKNTMIQPIRYLTNFINYISKHSQLVHK
jgi:hypothetical protein